MKREVGLCIIGTGRAGMIHGNNFNGRIPGAKLVALCDPSKESLKTAAASVGDVKSYEDYREALADEAINAVVIACPTKFHCEIAVAAAAAGKHILCEKPMAMNERECEEMIRAAKSYGVKLQVGFMRRFDESFQEAKRQIETGEIGEVVLVKSHTRGPSEPREWMYDIEKSNGPLAEVSSHDIDTARWFIDSEPLRVYAVGGNYRCREVTEQYPDFYDNILVSVEYENGMSASIEGAQYVEYGYDARVEILGTKGVICLGELHDKKLLTCTKNQGVSRPVMKSWTKLFKEAYLTEDKSFVDSIEKDEPVKVTGEDGLAAVRLVRAGNQSFKTKQVIELNNQ